jgi:translation initiation factor 1
MARKNDWKKRNGVVYSTDPDHPYRENLKAEPAALPRDKQNLRVVIDRRHRQGKEVTLVKGFVGPITAAEELCRMLKVRCGAGGAVKDGDIIIQGDQRQAIVSFLLKEGYRAR